jgi:hypothetical protein
MVRVIAGQNGNFGVLSQALAGATVNGVVKADVAAVAPYFTVDVDHLYQQYLLGQVNLNDVFTELHNNIDTVMEWASRNRDVATAAGIPLVSYEGGQHILAKVGDQQNDPNFVSLLTNINRDPRMGDMYKYMLDKWYGLGGGTFVFAAETATPSKWGAWGLKENYLDSNAVKFKAVQDYLKALPRSTADFDKNGAVDQQDFELWRSSFGESAAGSLFGDANNDGTTDAADWVMWRRQSVAAPARGDFNGDGRIDELDYAVWAESYGTYVAGTVDGNQNGVVDAADYVMWRSLASTPFASANLAAAVPEPSVLWLFAQAACISIARFNRMAVTNSPMRTIEELHRQSGHFP